MARYYTFQKRGVEQEDKSPFSLLSEPISPSSLLFEPISASSLNVNFSFLPPPYFSPLFLPPPNFVWAISPSSLFCCSPLSESILPINYDRCITHICEDWHKNSIADLAFQGIPFRSLNGPFLSSLFQKSLRAKSFLWKSIWFAWKRISGRNTFSYEWFRTKTFCYRGKGKHWPFGNRFHHLIARRLKANAFTKHYFFACFGIFFLESLW